MHFLIFITNGYKYATNTCIIAELEERELGLTEMSMTLLSLCRTIQTVYSVPKYPFQVLPLLPAGRVELYNSLAL
jgi:hypothetical protein